MPSTLSLNVVFKMAYSAYKKLLCVFTAGTKLFVIVDSFLNLPFPRRKVHPRTKDNQITAMKIKLTAFSKQNSMVVFLLRITYCDLGAAATNATECMNPGKYFESLFQR